MSDAFGMSPGGLTTVISTHLTFGDEGGMRTRVVGTEMEQSRLIGLVQRANFIIQALKLSGRLFDSVVQPTKGMLVR